MNIKQTEFVALTPMFLRVIINQRARTPVISEFLDRSPEGAPMETMGQSWCLIYLHYEPLTLGMFVLEAAKIDVILFYITPV